MQLPIELFEMIKAGESLTVEFKKSTSDITKDVYETVCSFSNRDGGHIFLGVKDDGSILGVQPHCIDRMKKDFVTMKTKCIRRFTLPLWSTNMTAGLSFTSVFPPLRASADAAAEFMTALTNPISTSQIILMKYIGFMQGKTDRIL